jgi:peptide/nickel transport system substrate-binding protein
MRKSLVFAVGVLIMLVLGAACAKGEQKAAAPAPAPSTPAPTAASAPAAAPAPATSAPSTQSAAPTPAPSAPAAAGVPSGQPVVPGGPPFFRSEVEKLTGYQFLQRWHVTKLSIWTKASYGGDHTGAVNWTPSTTLNLLGVLTLSRPSYAGMLLYTESGRCAWGGRNEDFSVCKGQYGKNQAHVLQPGIFTNWQQPDPTTYIFTVRKGVLWPAVPPMNRTDREMTAEDIVWFLNLTKEKGILKPNFALYKTIEPVDRYTVKITLTSPNADTVLNLAHTSMGLIAKECYEEKDCIGGKLITPGPFLLKISETRQRAIFEKNPEFYLKGAPYWDRMVLLNITDIAAQKAGFVTGKLDVYSATALVEAETLLKQVPGSQVHAPGGIGGVTMTLRPQLKGPLADVRVRRAMTMTLDHPQMWDAGFDGFSLFTPLISRDYFGADFYMTLAQAGENYQFNPTKAKQLLAEAGFPNGFATQIVYNLNSGVYYQYALYLQAQWKKHLNIDVKLQIIDTVTHTNQFYESTWDGLYWQSACWIRGCWGLADDAFAQFLKGSPQNVQKIDDPKTEEFYLKQRSELDPAKRVKLLWEFDQYELTQVYQIRVGMAASFNMMQPWEMNGASHETMWYTALNGPTWMGMHDISKYPGGRK